MKLKLVAIVFLFGFLNCFGQKKNELLLDLKNHKQLDTVRCNLLLKLIDQEDDFNVWITYNDELEKITFSNLNKYSSKILKDYYLYNYGNSLYNKSFYQTSNNQLKNGIHSAEKSLLYFDKLKKNDEISAAMNIIANNHQNLGNLKEAFIAHKKSILLAEGANDKDLIISSLHSLSQLYLINSNYKKAIELQFRILKIAEKNKTQKDIGDCLNVIGYFYIELSDLKKATIFLNKSLIIQQKISNNNGIATIYCHFAEIAEKNKNYNKALNFLERSQKLENVTENFKTYFKIGQIYRKLKSYDNALKNLNICIKLVERSENIVFLHKIYQEIAMINILLNNNIVAKVYLLKSIEFAKKFKTVEVLITSYKLLSDIEFKNKNFKKSLELFTKSTFIKDSLNKIDNKNLLLSAEFNYETEKKEAQIKDLSQQKQIAKLQSKQQKIGLVLLGFAIISILISGYLLFKRYKTNKQNEILRMQLLESSKTFEAEKKAAQSELKALKSQMNPHFIFNALNGIQEQFMFGDKVVANEQMGNFTALTRQILSVSGKKTITIATEIDLLTKYLELEKMRFETGFEYAISFSEKIDQDYDEIPPMIIQPFAENAIKHGLLHKLGDKKLSIFFDLSTNEDYLLCTITDNGVGRQKSAEIKAKSFSKHESFSTQSISQRLDILKKEGVDDELVVYEDVLDNDNLVVGTSVLVRIPVGE